MKNSVVEVIDNDLYMGSWQLSQVFEVEHRSFRRIIDKYMKQIVEVGEIELKERTSYCNSMVIRNGKKKQKKSPPIKEYLLNEPQATFVVLLLKGKYKTDKVSLVVKFKQHIASQFFKQRKLLTKLLAQKQNAEWLQAREQGKIDRCYCTDEIKAFVEYAIKQGSKNARKYYIIISKMENKTLFNFDFLSQKFPNIRDIATRQQLSTLEAADRIIAKAIKDGMEQGLHYKEIYKKAKDNLDQFSQIIGKTPLQVIYQKSPLMLN